MLTRQAVHVDAVRGEADAHVAVAALGHDPHLEVVQPTGGRDRVRRPHRRRILMRLAMSCNTVQRQPLTISYFTKV